MSETEDTALDAAFAAMEAAPEDDAARLRFYNLFAATELYLLLDHAPEGDRITPRLFPVDPHPVVLVFDREERLTRFTGTASPYAALSGRNVVALLDGQALGLGLNLDVAPSATLLPPDAVAWLASTLAKGPSEAEARPVEVAPPGNVPEDLLTALDAKLAGAAGLARRAWLAGVTYDTGASGHLLGFAGAAPGAEPALARAVNEALVFSGIEAGALDVVFLRDSDPLAARLARVGLRFDLPKEPAATGPTPPTPPGMDPDKPPKLR